MKAEGICYVFALSIVDSLSNKIGKCAGNKKTTRRQQEDNKTASMLLKIPSSSHEII
jgi:hypothetical protein